MNSSDRIEFAYTPNSCFMLSDNCTGMKDASVRQNDFFQVFRVTPHFSGNLSCVNQSWGIVLRKTLLRKRYFVRESVSFLEMSRSFETRTPSSASTTLRDFVGLFLALLTIIETSSPLSGGRSKLILRANVQVLWIRGANFSDGLQMVLESHVVLRAIF